MIDKERMDDRDDCRQFLSDASRDRPGTGWGSA